MKDRIGPSQNSLMPGSFAIVCKFIPLTISHFITSCFRLICLPFVLSLSLSIVVLVISQTEINSFICFPDIGEEKATLYKFLKISF